MSEIKKLGIVIPLANEEEKIEEFINILLKEIPQNTQIFCIVDKATKDNTFQKLQQISIKNTNIIPIFDENSRSAVDAYFRGYREALEANCDWILEMDGGMSHNPKEIYRFITAMEKGYDFAAGSRFNKGGVYIKPRIRYLISKGGTLLTNLLLGTKMKDMTSGFECFSRKAMQYVLAKGVVSRAHFFQTEIRYMLHNWNWIEIPISYRDPSKSVGKSSLKEAFKNLWFLYKENKKNKKN